MVSIGAMSSQWRPTPLFGRLPDKHSPILSTTTLRSVPKSDRKLAVFIFSSPVGSIPLVYTVVEHLEDLHGKTFTVEVGSDALEGAKVKLLYLGQIKIHQTDKDKTKGYAINSDALNKICRGHGDGTKQKVHSDLAAITQYLSQEVPDLAQAVNAGEPLQHGGGSGSSLSAEPHDFGEGGYRYATTSGPEAKKKLDTGRLRQAISRALGGLLNRCLSRNGSRPHS